MSLTPLNPQDRDAKDEEAFLYTGEGRVTIRHGEAFITIDFTERHVEVEISTWRDPECVYASCWATEGDLMEHAANECGAHHEDEYRIDDWTPPDFGPPGSGAVIIEYDVGTYDEPW